MASVRSFPPAEPMPVDFKRYTALAKAKTISNRGSDWLWDNIVRKGDKTAKEFEARDKSENM